MERNIVQQRGIVTNWIGIGIIGFFILCCWFFKPGYDAAIAFATPGICAGLAIMLLGNRKIGQLARDREFWLVAAGGVIAGVNILLVRSGFGAIFTIGCFLLTCYLCNKIQLTDAQLIVIGLLSIPYSIAWPFVKQTTYNVNTPGMILFALLTLICVALERLKGYWKKGTVLLSGLELAFFIGAYYVSDYYVARTSLGGHWIALALFVVFSIWPDCRWLKRLLAVGGTLGGLLLTIVFSYLYAHNFIVGGVEIPLNYLAGREIAWIEFWETYVQHPITGFGSDFASAIANWSGLEAHNALLSLLCVHGILVFLIALYLFGKRLENLANTSFRDRTVRTAGVAVYAMMYMSVFENFFCAGIYNGIFFIMLASALQKYKEKSVMESNE